MERNLPSMSGLMSSLEEEDEDERDVNDTIDEMMSGDNLI